MQAANLARPIEINSAPMVAPPCRGEEGHRPLTVYIAGNEIYGPGDEANGHFHIAFGAVRIYRLLADGRRQISAFHMAGESFGLESGDRHQFFAEAVCATGLRKDRALPALESMQGLLQLALVGMMRAQQHLLVVGRQNATERIGAFLLDMVERQGGLPQIELPMSRQDIGDYLGLTIKTVSRTLSKLREKGVIKFHGLRSVEVCKPALLKAICE